MIRYIVEIKFSQSPYHRMYYSAEADWSGSHLRRDIQAAQIYQRKGVADKVARRYNDCPNSFVARVVCVRVERCLKVIDCNVLPVKRVPAK